MTSAHIVGGQGQRDSVTCSTNGLIGLSRFSEPCRKLKHLIRFIDAKTCDLENRIKLKSILNDGVVMENIDDSVM